VLIYGTILTARGAHSVLSRSISSGEPEKAGSDRAKNIDRILAAGDDILHPGRGGDDSWIDLYLHSWLLHRGASLSLVFIDGQATCTPEISRAYLLQLQRRT
jgi:hypothetical protein